MRGSYQALTLVLAFTLLAGCATGGASRSEALKKIAGLKERGVQIRYLEEYQSLETAFDIGEDRLKNDDSGEAERYFRLAVMKGEILEEKSAQLLSAARKTPNNPAGSDSDGPAPSPTKEVTVAATLALASTGPKVTTRLAPQPAAPLAKRGTTAKLATHREPQTAITVAEPGTRPKAVPRLALQPAAPLAEPRPGPEHPVPRGPQTASPEPAVKKELTAELTQADRPIVAPAAIKDAPGEPRESVVPEPPAVPDSDRCELIVGGDTLYTVKNRDTIRLIGAKLGVSRKALVKDNNISAELALHKGQVLKVANRHIIPKKVRDGLVINIPDRTLYYFKEGVLVDSLPVALGKPKSKDGTVWTTPTGDFRVIAKIKDPTWRIPPSIQKEMKENGRNVVTEVAPGPANPLGRYAIRTSIPGILIHSTSAPASIYGFSSHGCIRVYPERMEELYKEVRLNSKGEIIYQPVKLAVTDHGRVYLEVHSDVYQRFKNLRTEVQDAIRKQKITEHINWTKVERMVKEQSGVAEDVSL